MTNPLFPAMPMPFMPQELPVQKIQQHWLNGISNMVSLELEAMMEYNHLWFSLWQDCATGDTAECHNRLADHWADHHKLLISHQKRREALAKEWKEHIEEVL